MRRMGTAPSITRRAALAAGVVAGLAASGCTTATTRPVPATAHDPRSGHGRGEARDGEVFAAPARGPARGIPAPGPSGRYAVTAPRRVDYRPGGRGPASEQNYGQLFVPVDARATLPVLVMIHGGGWAQATDLSYMTPLARDIASHGVAVFNIEYRRVGGGGGWPTTLTDVAAAVDAVAGLPAVTAARLDLARVHVCGHSAGGHLAGWVASRSVLPREAPGASPGLRVAGAVTLAGVFDLARADDVTKDRFVRGLLGGSDDQWPLRYRQASPIAHLPTGIPVTAVHGGRDRVVAPAQSRDYVARARAAGDPASLVWLPGVDHTALTDPSSPAWASAREQLLAQLRP